MIVAGCWHAAYGTEGFPTALFELDERELVAGTIGGEAEAIVYRYCSCDRRFAYSQIGREPMVSFRDRFTGREDAVGEADVRSFAELTVANELDVLAYNPTFRIEHGRAIGDLFASWAATISDAACADARAELMIDGGRRPPRPPSST